MPYDAIVIGSGLGGLTAGAVCAKAGKRVLVLERNERFGGAATVYQHNGLSIEASLHEIDGFDREDPKMPLVRLLGLDQALEFIDVGALYEVRGALVGKPFMLPPGPAAALAAATARFPEHQAALAEYFRRLITLRSAVSFAAAHAEERGWWLSHAPEAVRRLWPILRDGRATVGEVLDELFGRDERVKVLLAANLFYYHDDPYQMLFLRYAIPQASYLVGGGHYIRGGSQALTDRLAALIVQAGGKLEKEREATALLVENNHVTGVGHQARGGGDRRVDEAPVVFGNAAPKVLAQMLPEERRADFMAPYRQHHPSISLWTVSLGLNRPARDFGVRSYSTFLLPDWMKSLAQMREAAAIIAGRPGRQMPPYVLVDYSQIASGLNETGAHLLTLCGADRLENWSFADEGKRKAHKEAWLTALVADLDQHFPGLASSIVQREMATAATMHDYLNTPGGAVYGFAPDGTLAEAFRQGPRTSVEGLWLASAYTTAGGFTGAMLGGAQAASQAGRTTPALAPAHGG